MQAPPWMLSFNNGTFKKNTFYVTSYNKKYAEIIKIVLLVDVLRVFHINSMNKHI